MPDPVTAGIVGGSQLISSYLGGQAAGDAASAQVRASQQGIAEQRRQFDAIQELLKPFVQAGSGALSGFQPYMGAGQDALTQQRALMGLAGPEAQQAAIAQISASPEMQALTQQGETAILQNAAATGGLRGGNTQAALAQFRPQVLSNLLNQQLTRLGGLTTQGANMTTNLAQLGQSSAANQATAGLQTGANIADLMQQGGAARAGGILGQASAYNNILNLPMTALGAQIGAEGKLGMGFGNLF